MNGNFDFYTTIDNGDNADLTPFWEVAEAEHSFNIIQWAEMRLAYAESALSCAPEWFLDKYSNQLIAECEEEVTNFKKL